MIHLIWLLIVDIGVFIAWISRFFLQSAKCSHTRDRTD